MKQIKKPRKIITLSKIKWENCQEKHWGKIKKNHQCAKHTSKTTRKCKQKIQFQFFTLTIKTSLVSLAQNATPQNVDSRKEKKQKQMYGR
jgi:hypothetical protein